MKPSVVTLRGFGQPCRVPVGLYARVGPDGFARPHDLIVVYAVPSMAVTAAMLKADLDRYETEHGTATACLACGARVDRDRQRGRPRLYCADCGVRAVWRQSKRKARAAAKGRSAVLVVKPKPEP